MAFTGSFMCTSFKKELMQAKHNFNNSGGHTFKCALYTSAATLDATTTAFPGAGSGNECAASGGYTQGGSALTRVDPTTSGTTAFTDFADLTWGSSTITARGALIYNDTDAGKAAVCVLDFGSDKSSNNGNFTIVFPTADASNAIIRLT